MAARPPDIPWMPAPQAPTGCPPGLEYLTQIDQLLVHQQVELLEGNERLNPAREEGVALVYNTCIYTISNNNYLLWVAGIPSRRINSRSGES